MKSIKYKIQRKFDITHSFKVYSEISEKIHRNVFKNVQGLTAMCAVEIDCWLQSKIQ